MGTKGHPPFRLLNPKGNLASTSIHVKHMVELKATWL